MKTLQEQLEAIKASTASRMTPEIIADMKQGYEELAENKVLEKALKTGDTAPAFILPNSQGNMIRSQDFITKGPLVVLFYRGKMVTLLQCRAGSPARKLFGHSSSRRIAGCNIAPAPILFPGTCKRTQIAV